MQNYKTKVLHAADELFILLKGFQNKHLHTLHANHIKKFQNKFLNDVLTNFRALKLQIKLSKL